MSVVLFWPRFRRALLALLSLVNVSLSCLHSIHFVSLIHLHSISCALIQVTLATLFLGFWILGGFGNVLPALHPLCQLFHCIQATLFFGILDLVNVLPCLRSIHFVSLHSPLDYLQSNAKKKKLFSCTQATHFSWDCAISFLC